MLRNRKGGSAFDRQIHQELCCSVNAVGKLARENQDNPHAQTLAPVVYHFSVLANEQQDPTIKAHLSDFCHYIMRGSEGAVRLGQSMTRVAGMVAQNYAQHKAEFYQGMLTCPMDTLYKEFVAPLEMAGTALGKAVILACTNPTQFQQRAVRQFQQLALVAQADPEHAAAVIVELLIPYGSKNLAQLKQVQPLLNMIKEQKKLATACAVGHITDAAKKALEPIKEVIILGVKSHGLEKIFDKVKSYEQARNKALGIIGDMGHDSIPYRCRLKASKAYGKIIGRESADGKVRWRLDYDGTKGPHINIEDFRAGKQLKAIRIAIPFEGDETVFVSLLKQLNK